MSENFLALIFDDVNDMEFRQKYSIESYQFATRHTLCAVGHASDGKKTTTRVRWEEEAEEKGSDNTKWN